MWLSGCVIDLVLVVGARELARGIRRLLESEGDIRVVADLESLDPGSLEAFNSIVVVGPGVDPDQDSLAALASRGMPVVMLAPVPEARGNGVTEVAMELSGQALRAAVRQAVNDRPGS